MKRLKIFSIGMMLTGIQSVMPIVGSLHVLSKGRQVVAVLGDDANNMTNANQAAVDRAHRDPYMQIVHDAMKARGAVIFDAPAVLPVDPSLLADNAMWATVNQARSDYSPAAVIMADPRGKKFVALDVLLILAESCCQMGLGTLIESTQSEELFSAFKNMTLRSRVEFPDAYNQLMEICGDIATHYPATFEEYRSCLEEFETLLKTQNDPEFKRFKLFKKAALSYFKNKQPNVSMIWPLVKFIQISEPKDIRLLSKMVMELDHIIGRAGLRRAIHEALVNDGRDYVVVFPTNLLVPGITSYLKGAGFKEQYAWTFSFNDCMFPNVQENSIRMRLVGLSKLQSCAKAELGARCFCGKKVLKCMAGRYCSSYCAQVDNDKAHPAKILVRALKSDPRLAYAIANSSAIAYGDDAEQDASLIAQ